MVSLNRNLLMILTSLVLLAKVLLIVFLPALLKGCIEYLIISVYCLK